ncbi:hypothetical protein OH76DRAFT_1257120 [Lentinus brumalis]|uniref:Peptidase C14 caspase domain-containing protein n=1 Tax=Lentinus brumalis TaxID=2498619 RepID=A0A371CRL7_9APHY|nr:hypothetical protein OH76DRAFT_1257120 [Polyporus brumalis]
MNVLIDLQGLLMRMLDSLYPDLAATLQAIEIDIPDMSKLLRRLTQPSSTLHAPAESRREPTKKALIIGINYVAHEKEEMKLRGAHDDARGWMKLCIETYGFPESDITLMLDDDSVTAELRPTRANILHQINEFVEGVQPGDHLVFFYSGHSGQVESKSMNEDDGLDEVLMPLDNEGVSPQSADKLILDDELRRLLVDPLPVGSTLTAIFDSCHSGTLLDLDHYLCNNIWFPFMSRGKRQARSRCMAVSRRNGLNVQHVPIPQADGKDNGESVIRAPSSPLPSSKPFPSRRTTLERAQSFASVVGDMTATGFLELVRFSSPEEMVNLCNGFDCKNSDEPKARAFSFSACRDPEETFDGPRGRSMTKTMIEVLEKNPHPTYRELLHHVGHKLYGVRRIIQEKNNKNMQKRKQGKNSGTCYGV